jgi:hypothetical protein
MRRWIVCAALTVFLTVGCNSTPHPPAEKEEKPEFGTTAPSAETAPFAQ